MKRTYYIAPKIGVAYLREEELLVAATTLDNTKDEQDVDPDDEEYNGEFGANQSIWDNFEEAFKAGY